MNTNDYIKNRYEDQRDWLSKKAESNQNRYRFLRVLSLICAVSIPFLTGFVSDEAPFFKILIGVLGVVIAFCEGVLSLYKYQDNWITYRNTLNSLTREKALFDTESGSYFGLTEVDAFRNFVSNVENILSNENALWLANVKANGKEK